MAKKSNDAALSALQQLEARNAELVAERERLEKLAAENVEQVRLQDKFGAPDTVRDFVIAISRDILNGGEGNIAPSVAVGPDAYQRRRAIEQAIVANTHARKQLAPALSDARWKANYEQDDLAARKRLAQAILDAINAQQEMMEIRFSAGTQEANPGTLSGHGPLSVAPIINTAACPLISGFLRVIRPTTSAQFAIDNSDLLA